MTGITSTYSANSATRRRYARAEGASGADTKVTGEKNKDFKLAQNATSIGELICIHREPLNQHRGNRTSAPADAWLHRE